MRGVDVLPADAGSPGVALACDADVESTPLVADAHGGRERRDARRDERALRRWISLAMVGLLALVLAAIVTRPPPARSADLEMHRVPERPDAERHRANIVSRSRPTPADRDDETTPSRTRRRTHRRATDQNTRD
jgi:hypothetical protein